MAGDDWSEYRKLLLDTMQRLDSKATDVQTQVHEINTQLAAIKNDVARHNNQDARINSLERLTERYNLVLSVLAVALTGVWAYVIKTIFDAE